MRAYKQCQALKKRATSGVGTVSIKELPPSLNPKVRTLCLLLSILVAQLLVGLLFELVFQTKSVLAQDT